MSKLRQSARRCPHCMSCGIQNPNNDRLCLAHSNRLQDGKGMGLKSHDEAGAIVCDLCHSLIDGRINTLSREQRQEMHLLANIKTVAWWKREGYLSA